MSGSHLHGTTVLEEGKDSNAEMNGTTCKMMMGNHNSDVLFSNKEEKSNTASILNAAAWW